MGVAGGEKKEVANEQGGTAAAVVGEKKERVTTCFAPRSPKTTLYCMSLTPDHPNYRLKASLKSCAVTKS
jgi:hypothetical protein